MAPGPIKEEDQGLNGVTSDADLPPHRAQLARYILEALHLAREQNDEMTVYLLEMALKEVLPRDPTRGEVLGRLNDPQSRTRADQAMR